MAARDGGDVVPCELRRTEEGRRMSYAITASPCLDFLLPSLLERQQPVQPIDHVLRCRLHLLHKFCDLFAAERIDVEADTAGLLVSEMVNTDTASGPRPRLRSGRNSAHC